MTSTRHDAGPVAPIVQRANHRAAIVQPCFARSRPVSQTRKESLGDAPISGERETPFVLCAQTFHNEPNPAPNPDMIRQRDYAIHSNLTKGHISTLVKRGMPLDSVQAADDWRRAHTLARKLPAPPPQEPHDARPAAGAAPERPPELPGEDVAAGACEPVRAAWERLLTAERLAWASVVQSIKARQPDASRLVGVHAQCVKNLIDNRARVMQQAQAEGQMVSAAWVRQNMLAHDGTVAALIRNMPRQLASRVNPADVEHAERTLQLWVDEVCLRTLSETSPWKD